MELPTHADGVELAYFCDRLISQAETTPLTCPDMDGGEHDEGGGMPDGADAVPAPNRRGGQVVRDVEPSPLELQECGGTVQVASSEQGDNEYATQHYCLVPGPGANFRGNRITWRGRMRLLNPDSSSEGLDGCDRLWDDGDDILVQHRPANAADHRAILPNYVPEGEILGRVSKVALLEAARNLRLT